MSVDYRGLSTIHFYIILKHTMTFSVLSSSLSTIHFYIILKLASARNLPKIV